MVIKTGMSISEWVFKDIVEARPGSKNRSEWIEELLIKGYLSITGQTKPLSVGQGETTPKTKECGKLALIQSWLYQNWTDGLQSSCL